SENFFDECKDSSAIRSAVFSGSTQFLDVNYSGQDHRVMVTTIDKLGPERLTLVVFHNNDLIRTISLAMIFTGAGFVGVYLLIILIIAAFDLLSGAAYPPKMIWPCRENSPRYFVVCVFNALLVLAFAALYSFLWGLGLLIATTLTLVVGIVGTI